VIDHLLTNLVNENWTDWDEHLLAILFSYMTTFKVSTSYIPFQLVYRLHPLMPIKYIVPTRRIDGALDYTPMRVLTTRLSDLDCQTPCSASGRRKAVEQSLVELAALHAEGLSVEGLCPLVS
jgi:hypothetical protein